MPWKIPAALAAASLLGASSAALARSADPLSLADAPAVKRAGAETEGVGALRGGRWIIGAVVLGPVIWGIIELAGDDERDFPSSP